VNHRQFFDQAAAEWDALEVMEEGARIMICDRCGEHIQPGEEMPHFGQMLCEECYTQALSPARCDPWAVRSAQSLSQFVSIEKIKATLGWSPRYSNAETLIRSYQWYLDHHRELDRRMGITHRVAWNQGILKVIKKLPR